MQLKKSDTVALWHAVVAQEELLKAMRGMPFSPEQIEAAAAALKASKAALRKVNAIRRASLPKRAIAVPA